MHTQLLEREVALIQSPDLQFLLDNEYYASAVIYRWLRGRLAFLLMQTAPVFNGQVGDPRWQFPGGMKTFGDTRNPFRTLSRELKEETGLSLRQTNRPDPEILGMQQYDKHLRLFFLVPRTSCEGIVRMEVKRDNNSVLYLPEWKNYEFVGRNLWESQNFLLPKLREIKLRGPCR